VDRVEVGSPHEFRVTMNDPGESLGESGSLEVDHILAPRLYHLVLGHEEGVFL